MWRWPCPSSERPAARRVAAGNYDRARLRVTPRPSRRGLIESRYGTFGNGRRCIFAEVLSELYSEHCKSLAGVTAFPLYQYHSFHGLRWALHIQKNMQCIWSYHPTQVSMYISSTIKRTLRFVPFLFVGARRVAKRAPSPAPIPPDHSHHTGASLGRCSVHLHGSGGWRPSTSVDM